MRLVVGAVATTLLATMVSLPPAVAEPFAEPFAEPLAEPAAERATSPASAPTIDWRSCGQRFDCARVRVPLDYDRPDGRTLSVALIKLSAADPARRIGTLFVNPGGPGEFGVDFVRHEARSAPPETRAHALRRHRVRPSRRRQEQPAPLLRQRQAAERVLGPDPLVPGHSEQTSARSSQPTTGTRPAANAATRHWRHT